MIKMPKGPGRNPVKRDQIIGYIKDNIIAGTWKSGERIPARIFLEKRFSASSVTVQQALDLLVKDGFVRVMGRRGTFVNEKLPYQNNYALIFPDSSSEKAKRNAYFATMDGEAKRLQKSIPGKILRYYNINSHRSDSFYKLVEDIRESRLAGLIFASSPHELVKTPILDHPGIPRVAFTHSERFNIPVINMGTGNFVRMCIDYLLEQGCKRIALLDTSGFRSFPQFLEELGDRVDFIPEWHQTVSLNYPQAAGQITQLLMSKHYAKRPDGLIITDDNLTPFVQKALLQLNVDVPGELILVSLCNFPSNILLKPPVKLIGLPIHKGLELGVDLINKMRAGKKVPSQSSIPLTFDE